MSNVKNLVILEVVPDARLGVRVEVGDYLQRKDWIVGVRLLW